MPTILIKKNDTPGAAPTGSDLTNLAGGAEIAVNTADKRVFSMNSSSAIIELGTNPGSLTTADASATVFRSGSATITNLIATTGTIADLRATTASATVGRIDSGTITNLTSTSATITTLKATSATIDNFTFTSATVTRLAATSAVISDLSATVGRIGSATITNLIASGGSVTLTTAGVTSGNITTLTSASGTITNLIATTATVTDLRATTASATVSRAGSATLTNLTSTSGTITTLVSSSGTLTNLTSTSGTITTLVSTSATLTTIAGTSANITTITENASPVVVQTDIGTAPNEVPLNQYLGTMAFQDADAITVGQIAANGVVSLDNAVTINDSGADVDFRVEGDTDANLLFVDASTDRIGVGTDTPLAKFQVGNGTATTEIRIDADGGSGNGGFIRGYKDTSNASWYFGDLNPIAGGTNDGLCAYAYGANPFVLYTNGLERLRVDSAGNLGLGVTPSAWGGGKAIELAGTGLRASLFMSNSGVLALSQNYYFNGGADIYAANGFATRYYQLNGQHVWNIAPSGTAGDPITFTQAMTLDASGNLGVGTTSPVTLKSATTLQVNGNCKLGNAADRGLLSLGDTASTGANVGVWRGAAGAYGSAGNYLNLGGYDGITFTTGAADIDAQTERARITSDGDFCVNRTTKAYEGLISVGFDGGGGSGDQGIALLDTNASLNGDYILFINHDGNVAGKITRNGTTTVAYTTSSDYRLKENIALAPEAGEKIDAIQIISHDWKSVPDEHVEYGVIAQDLHAIAPQAVIAGDSGEEVERVWGVDYSKLVPLLVKEIQSLRARVAALEGAN